MSGRQDKSDLDLYAQAETDAAMQEEGFYLDDLLDAWKAQNSQLSPQKAEQYFNEAINRELALVWEEGRYAGASWATTTTNPYRKKDSRCPSITKTTT